MAGRHGARPARALAAFATLSSRSWRPARRSGVVVPLFGGWVGVPSGVVLLFFPAGPFFKEGRARIFIRGGQPRTAGGAAANPGHRQAPRPRATQCLFVRSAITVRQRCTLGSRWLCWCSSRWRWLGRGCNSDLPLLFISDLPYKRFGGHAPAQASSGCGFRDAVGGRGCARRAVLASGFGLAWSLVDGGELRRLAV